MKMKQYILFAGMLMAFTGCVKVQPQLPLEQELAGKTGVQRKEILINECKDEARHRAVKEFHPYGGHQVYHQHLAAEFELMKVCNNIKKEFSIAGDEERKAVLAVQCHGEANSPKVKNPERIKRMNLVCDKISEELQNNK